MGGRSQPTRADRNMNVAQLTADSSAQRMPSGSR